MDVTTIFTPFVTLLELEWLFEGTVRDRLTAVDGPVAYALVFVLAAIPWIEIVVVIPIGIAVGLDPVLVACSAFFGNLFPVYGIVLADEWITGWFERSNSESSRYARARRIWNAYGVPGLATVAPILTGVHLATIVALGLGGKRRSTLLWMSCSLAAWSVLITAGTLLGVSLLGSL